MSLIDDTLVGTMPLPDLDYQQLLVPADRAKHPAALIAALRDLNGLEPRPNELGNIQGVYRLDWHPDENGSLILTFPAAADRKTVQRTIDKHEAPDPDEPPAGPPSVEEVVAASVSAALAAALPVVAPDATKAQHAEAVKLATDAAATAARELGTK